MAGNKSGIKGGGGERELCKILSESIGGSYERTKSSGAMIGGKNAWRKENLSVNQVRSYKGDIVPPDELPKLVVESKFYKDFKYHSFALNQSIPKLDEWIIDLEYDCDPGDIGFICIKINFKGWMVIFHKDLFNKFVIHNHVCYNDYIGTSLLDFLHENKETLIQLCKDE